MPCVNEISMPPVKRGDTWSYVFSWNGPTEPINLQSCSARMQIREKKTREVVASISSEDHIIIQASEGKTIITVPADITRAINPGIYMADIELTFSNPEYVISSQTFLIPVEEDITV